MPNGTYWTAEEQRDLDDMAGRFSYAEMAKRLGRTEASIAQRLYLCRMCRARGVPMPYGCAGPSKRAQRERDASARRLSKHAMQAGKGGRDASPDGPALLLARALFERGPSSPEALARAGLAVSPFLDHPWFELAGGRWSLTNAGWRVARGIHE